MFAFTSSDSRFTSLSKSCRKKVEKFCVNTEKPERICSDFYIIKENGVQSGMNGPGRGKEGVPVLICEERYKAMIGFECVNKNNVGKVQFARV